MSRVQFSFKTKKGQIRPNTSRIKLVRWKKRSTREASSCTLQTALLLLSVKDTGCRSQSQPLQLFSSFIWSLLSIIVLVSCKCMTASFTPDSLHQRHFPAAISDESSPRSVFIKPEFPRMNPLSFINYLWTKASCRIGQLGARGRSSISCRTGLISN